MKNITEKNETFFFKTRNMASLGTKDNKSIINEQNVMGKYKNFASSKWNNVGQTRRMILSKKK